MARQDFSHPHYVQKLKLHRNRVSLEASTRKPTLLNLLKVMISL
jgi:hypothetical protein